MPRTRPAFDPAAIDHLRSSHRSMRALIDRLGPPTLRIESLGDPYEALVRSIVYQQLHGKAAATILARVCQLFDADTIPRPEHILGATTLRLRSAGLSGSKTTAIQDLARKTADGLIPPYRSLARMSDDAIVERLTQVRGIGRWSVEMLLLFRMGRPDVWPTGDFAVRKSYGQLFGLADAPTPSIVAAGGERWRPFRSAAAWYLWRALDAPT